MSETPQDKFEKRSREVLEESASRLDGRTQSRLTQARYAALGQLERPARNRWWAFAPAGAAAAVAVLAVIMWTGRPGIPDNTSNLVKTDGQGLALDDLDILADADAEFVADEEDLEFYEWAAGELES
jgi:hypothetical protein